MNISRTQALVIGSVLLLVNELADVVRRPQLSDVENAVELMEFPVTYGAVRFQESVAVPSKRSPGQPSDALALRRAFVDYVNGNKRDGASRGL